MSFAAPIWLITAGLIALVVLLHTMRQAQRVVPSLYLWRRLAVSQRPRRALRMPPPSLLLLLQILAVLALAAALAYPLIGGTPRATHHVLVIDRSASMGALGAQDETRLDEALAMAASEIEALRGIDNATVSVIEAGAATRYALARQAPSSAVSDMVANLQPTAGAPDWVAVGTRLAGLAAGDEDQRIVIFTDDGAEARAALASAAPDAQIVVRAPMAGTGLNYGVSAQARPLERENGWEISGTISGDPNAEAPTLDLRYRPFGGATTLDWAEPVLARPRSVSEEEALATPFGFSTEVDLPGPGIVELVLGGDAAPYDDRFTFVLDDPLARAEVLYIGPGNRNLNLALLSTGLVALSAGQALPADAERYDLVIAENVALERRPATNVLWLGSAHLEGEPAPTRTPAELTRWDDGHPLSRSVDWRTLEDVDGYVFAQRPAGTVVLEAGEDPLLLARTLASGRDIRLAMAVDGEGWAASSVLPALIVNIIDWLATGVDVPALACEAGARCTFPARHTGAAITSPDGAAIRMAATTPEDVALLDSANSFVPERAGLHIVGEGAEARPIAVNAAGRAIGLPLAPPDPGDPVEPALAAGFPLWAWLVLAAAVILALEAALALRRREGFARTAQLGASVAAVRRKRISLALRGAAVLFLLLAVFVPPFPALVPARTDVLVAAPAALQPAEAACGGLLPVAVGQVALTGVPTVVRDGRCGAVEAGSEPGRADTGAATAEALELAAALLPPSGEGRIVLAADGASASAPIDTVLEPLLAGRVPLEVVLSDAEAVQGIWASALSVPATIREGDTAAATVIVGSAAATEAEIVFGIDDREISRGTFPLEPGATRIDAGLPQLEQGEVLIWAQVTAAGDGEGANDRVEALRDVLPRPTIAVITPEREWGEYMVDALAVQGLDAQVVAPNRAPFWMHDWLADYDGVVLMNVPALDLDTRQQEQLDEYVRIHGRGLMILGGENTFGPGGYFQTPLEAVSPLSSRVPQEAPVAALTFVLDRSGSMQAMVDGVTRLDIAKQATISAVELLNPESQVAVVVFDEIANVIVPLQERKDEAEITAALGRLDPGGGTSIAPGLEEALNQMEGADAPVKHIIVMSDGLSQPGDFETLMDRAAAMGITVSTVAIGDGADVGRLSDLARIGGGTSHATRDFRALPAILSQEAMMLGGDSMEFGSFPVTWLDRNAAFLDGLPELPPLNGYVLTSEKPEATLHLATVDAEGERVPIMASWRYGNGQVLALATHAVGPGSLDWQALPQFPQLYGQPMRHFLAEAPNPGLSVKTRRTGDALVVEVEALTRAGQALSGLAPMVQVVDSEGLAVSDLALQPDRPGVYIGRTGPLAPGRYRVAAEAGEDPETRAHLAAETEVMVSYPAALDPFRAAPERLAALAAQTGGTVTATMPALGGGLPRIAFVPAWRPLLVLALALFLLDLALRYAPGVFAWRRTRGRVNQIDREGANAAAAPLPRAA